MPSFAFIFVLLCAFSTVGYLAFGPGVRSNVLQNLPSDALGRSTQVAMCVACLMVYPNMLRPMVKPLLRGMEWLTRVRRGTRSPEAEQAQDVYEGRLVHTELLGPVEVEPETGEATIEVADTRGFERDALVFLDGRIREYAIVKEVLPAAASTLSPLRLRRPGPAASGLLRLRPRYGADAQRPVVGDDGRPACALSTALPIDTKVVLDEDPVLVTAAAAGEMCLHMSFTIGLPVGAAVMVGEGTRAERHTVVGTEALQPEKESVEAHMRTHDLVLLLGEALQHHHGAHTRVVLDHGATEVAATAIVMAVMATAFAIDNLGVVNVINGAISVSVLVGIVPALCAWHLHAHWGRPRDTGAPSCGGAQPPMPLCIRYKQAAAALVITSVVAGIVCPAFTDNHSQDLSDSCSWRVA